MVYPFLPFHMFTQEGQYLFQTFLSESVTLGAFLFLLLQNLTCFALLSPKLALEIRCSFGILTVFTLKERCGQIHLPALVDARHCYINQSVKMCLLWRKVCFLIVLPYYQVYCSQASVGNLFLAKGYIDLSDNFDKLYIKTHSCGFYPLCYC